MALASTHDLHGRPGIRLFSIAFGGIDPEGTMILANPTRVVDLVGWAVRHVHLCPSLDLGSLVLDFFRIGKWVMTRTCRCGYWVMHASMASSPSATRGVSAAIGTQRPTPKDASS